MTKNIRPLQPEIQTNFLIDENDSQQTLINILQVSNLVAFIADQDLSEINADGQLGLQLILKNIIDALWHEIYRLTPEE